MTKELIPERVRYDIRFRQLHVITTEKFHPKFIRITVGGTDLEGFDSRGFDDHVKLFFPDPVTGKMILPQMGENGLVWPEGARPVARDFTPLTYNKAAQTLTIDFAIHSGGPAIEWALHAKPGDVLGVGGPRGSFIVPKEYDWHILIGDETAFPAISKRLAELPNDVHVIVVAETDQENHQFLFSDHGQINVHWAYHNQKTHPEDVLVNALKTIALPKEGTGFIWAACEAASTKQIRDYFREIAIASPKNTRISAYWKQGQENTHDTLES